MARGPTATSAFQPELGAMLAADRRAASRILRERGGFLAAVTALLVGMEWVMASDIIGQFGLSVEMVASVAPFLVPLFAAAALAGFGPVAIRTDALPILKTLPCRARPLYAHAALSFLTTTATWSLVFTVPLAAALAVTQSPQAGYLTLCLGLALPATALSVSLGRYISAATSNRTGPVRWAAWAALGAFLVVPLAAPVAGLPYRPSAIDGGPALLFSQSIALAATEGPLAMVATVLVMVAAGAALSFAPLGRSYDRPSRSRPSPFLADDEEELPDLRPAGLFAPSARQRAAFRSLRGAVPQDDKGPNMRALEMPEGPVATLRFLTANPIALKEVLQMAGILGGALLFLVAFVLWYDPAPLELPAVDLVRVAFLLMLLLAAAACAYRAPSHRHNRELRVLRHRADSVKDGFADRPRRVFGIRSWEMLQTLPVDRAALEDAFYRPKAILLSLAVSAGGLSVLEAYVGGPEGLAVGALVASICISCGGFVAFPFFASAAVAPLSSPRSREMLGLGAFGWTCASVLFPFAAFTSIPDDLRWVATPSSVASAVACGLLAIAVPLLFYQAARERLVASQRPFETEGRYFAIAYGGPAALAAALALVLPVLW